MTSRHALAYSLIKPKFHYADFHRNFPEGKVVDTNHESRGHKRWQIMKPWSFGESRRHKSRKSRTQTISTCRDVCDKVRDKSATNPFVAVMEFSPLQCTGKVGDKVRFSRTQITKVRDTKHESWRRDLWRGLLWFVSATLSGTCPGLCRKVGVMEFGLYWQLIGWLVRSGRTITIKNLGSISGVVSKKVIRWKNSFRTDMCRFSIHEITGVQSFIFCSQMFQIYKIWSARFHVLK